MISLIVAGIVYILPFLGGFQIHLWALETSKASEATLRLCHHHCGETQHHC